MAYTSNRRSHHKEAPSSKLLVHIEPYRLWTIKVLNRFNIITRDELANLLEQYLDSVNKIRANISIDTERESDEYLVTLEPTKWKDQDHYLVLGLQHLRYKATEDDIRQAHKRKALKHHPDKRSKSQKVDLESDYYSCITRAMDILGDPIKRRSFDSVDPLFDDSIPNPIKPTKLEKNRQLFYKTFGPIFELNSRWSVKQNVPYLGNDLSTREQVEYFYDYWYNFQSWREFSYLDEEDKEKGENRDERRWLDRQNKAERQQRKKTENQRVRQLVDNAYSCDPRIAKFKEEDKQKKLDMKRAKHEEIRLRIEREEAEKNRIEEEDRQKKLAREDEEKKRRMEEKRQREQAKKEIKKAVKSLEEIFKANEYFVSNPRDKIKHIEELDKLTKMLSLNEIREFKDEIDHEKEFKDKQTLFLSRIDTMNDKIDEEKKLSMVKNSPVTNGDENGKSKAINWTEDEIKLLVKAVSMFPAGTKDRWEVVANYMGQHSPNHIERSSKEVLGKVKQIQEKLTMRR